MTEDNTRTRIEVITAKELARHGCIDAAVDLIRDTALRKTAEPDQATRRCLSYTIQRRRRKDAR